ncbi:MAG: ABC transporter substrate-binding protein [Anaerolineaceae bacterium]|nr:ABC transporter substrate-binding protein [Anaerolineaceae bacterium]
MSKKLFALFLVLVLALVMIPGSVAQEVTPAGEYPITTEPVTLKVLIQGHAIVEDFRTNAFTEWYMEKTGVQLEIEVTPPASGGGMNEALSLVLASGDLPDIILGFDIPLSTLSVYGSQGLFLPLNDLIDQYGFHIQEVYEGSPLVEPLIMSPDGNIYGLPQVNECYHCYYSQRLYINQQWLDNLGLEMPQTTEDFFNVLVAFKEQDANGNGDPNDEIPFAAAATGGNTNLDGFLMNPFVYSEQFNNRYLMMEDGVIAPAINTEGWREGLRYLNQMYQAGLFGEESFTQEHTQMRQLIENESAALLGALPAHNPSVFASIAGERWKEYTAVPALEGPSGLRQAAYNPYAVSSGRCVISANTAYPEIAFRFCDGFYDREATLRSVFGLPDEQWRWAEDGEIGLNGEPAIWRRLSTFGELQNVHWAQVNPSYRPNHLRLGEAQRGPEDLEVRLYSETKERMEPYARPLGDVIPPLSFTLEQATELADLELSLEDYIRQMEAEFVLGRADLDSGWDAYVSTLDTLGLARWVEIHQEAYDTQFGAE